MLGFDAAPSCVCWWEERSAAVDHEGRLWPEVGIEWASQLDGAECVGAGGIGGEQSEGLQLRGRRDEALDRVPYDGEEAHSRGGLHPGVGAEVRASQRRLAADSASARTSAGRVEVATVAVGERLGRAGQVTRGAWAGGAYSLVNVGAGRLVHVREGQPPLRTAQELEITGRAVHGKQGALGILVPQRRAPCGDGVHACGGARCCS
mmetsp:Transcript_33917/g.106806  ORF Transcript_33917/g.106806 Transcript_33917/m.106806 type:complete len:206 (+) Transcript_33917:349-966(+)